MVFSVKFFNSLILLLLKYDKRSNWWLDFGNNIRRPSSIVNKQLRVKVFEISGKIGMLWERNYDDLLKSWQRQPSIIFQLFKENKKKNKT